jgi:hypothetical protein
MKAEIAIPGSASRFEQVTPSISSTLEKLQLLLLFHVKVQPAKAICVGSLQKNPTKMHQQ